MPQPEVVIRDERPADAESVATIVRRAFAESELGHHGEAELVARLRRSCPDALALVAEIDGAVVGQVLFTPAVLEAGASRISGVGLAPLAVLPEYQRTGIGTRLVERGVARLREQGQPFVVVLGNPQYYARFGFVPANEHGIGCEFSGVPHDVFRILIFDDQRMPKPAGIVKYRPEFSELA